MAARSRSWPPSSYAPRVVKATSVVRADSEPRCHVLGGNHLQSLANRLARPTSVVFIRCCPGQPFSYFHVTDLNSIMLLAEIARFDDPTFQRFGVDLSVAVRTGHALDPFEECIRRGAERVAAGRIVNTPLRWILAVTATPIDPIEDLYEQQRRLRDALLKVRALPVLAVSERPDEYELQVRHLGSSDAGTFGECEPSASERRYASILKSAGSLSTVATATSSRFRRDVSTFSQSKRTMEKAARGRSTSRSRSIEFVRFGFRWLYQSRSDAAPVPIAHLLNPSGEQQPRLLSEWRASEDAHDLVTATISADDDRTWVRTSSFKDPMNPLMKPSTFSPGGSSVARHRRRTSIAECVSDAQDAAQWPTSHAALSGNSGRRERAPSIPRTDQISFIASARSE